MMRGKPIFFLFGIIIVVAMILLILRKGDNDPVVQSMPATEKQPAIVEGISHQDTVSMSEESPSIITQQTESASLNTAEVQPDDEAVQSGSNSVRVAGQEFPLLFESPGVSDVLKDVIIHDVELNLSHFEHITLRDVSDDPEDPGQGSSLTVTHLLDEGRQDRLFPEVFEKYFGGVIVSNGVSRIVIRDELIKEYERALDYKAQHPVMFDRLEKFLTRLRSEQFLKAIENDPEDARNMFFFDQAPSEGFDYSQQLSGFLKNATIREPSILDFYPAENYGIKEGTVCMPLLIWPKGMSREPAVKGVPLFIYIGEEWRMYVPRLP